MSSLSDALDCCCYSLDDWQVVAVKGPDAINYLQGQLTNDLTQLPPLHSQFAAHCDPKGKVLSNLLLFRDDAETVYYLLRRSVAQQQVDDLKKYAIFSKVTIDLLPSMQLLGLAGKKAETILAQLFTNLPQPQQIKQVDAVTIIRLEQPTTRFILLAEAAALAPIQAKLAELNVTPSDSQQWATLEIEAGYAIIDQANFLQFIPQAIGLEHIGGISFDKGCYRGQETVARAHYRGMNKRALYRLIGTSPVLPEIGDALEQQIEQSWRATGRVLAAVRLNDEQILVQAVLSNELEPDTQFRVKQQAASKLELS